MQYSLVNGSRAEAQKGLQGICVHCQNKTIAKCGNKRIPHWAHKSTSSCDPWWENETEWHRAWKKYFPEKWREVSHIDVANGERHIADIKTDKGFVIEFQHSAIKPDEIKDRENFYKSMVWVVDGTRLIRDYPRFCKGFADLRSLGAGFFLSSFPDECFPLGWLNSLVPVYFDFQNDDLQQQDQFRSVLWCLFPGRVEGFALVAGVLREDFIKFASNDSQLLFACEIRSEILKLIQQERAASERRNYPKGVTSPLQYSKSQRHRKYRL